MASAVSPDRVAGRSRVRVCVCSAGFFERERHAHGFARTDFILQLFPSLHSKHILTHRTQEKRVPSPVAPPGPIFASHDISKILPPKFAANSFTTASRRERCPSQWG